MHPELAPTSSSIPDLVKQVDVLVPNICCAQGANKATCYEKKWMEKEMLNGRYC